MSDINPYQAPQAAVLEQAPDTSSLAEEPNRVDIGRGLAWLGEGWGLFRQAPLVWIAVCVLSLITVMVLAWIPVIGQLTTTLLSVLIAGGLMIGCRDLDQGDDLAISHMIAGLQRHFVPLLIVGALYLASIFVLIVSTALITGGTMVGLIQGGVQPGMALTSVLLALVAFGIILIPIGMAICFAPALIALNDMPPVEAMKASFRGCLRNWLAFVLYGAVAFVLALLATMPFGLGWLILLPVLAGSVYAGYKDIFLHA